MTRPRTPVTGRSAWRPSDFPGPDAYSVTLTDAHLAAFDAALGTARARGRSLDEATLHDFALDAIAADLAGWRDEVLHGRGFVVLRGLDRDRYTPDELATIFWGARARTSAAPCRRARWATASATSPTWAARTAASARTATAAS